MSTSNRRRAAVLSREGCGGGNELDLVFVGPVIGGLLALGGTLYLAFSANKRESIAAVERKLHGWHRISTAPRKRFSLVGTGSEPLPTIEWGDRTDFIAQRPFLWGDGEAWHAHRILCDVVQGRRSIADFESRLESLLGRAGQRVERFAMIAEDMKRRSAWTFPEPNYVDDPSKYRFRRIKE